MTTLTPNDRIVIPGGTWAYGDFPAPLPTPKPDGPFEAEGDERFLWFTASFVVHAEAIKRIYSILEDRKQWQRWDQAAEQLERAICGTFGSTGARAIDKAKKHAQGIKVEGTIGEESSWSGHALWIIRQIEIAWRENGARRLSCVVNSRELVCRAIRSSLHAR